jgi:FkbM family methyltransferase
VISYAQNAEDVVLARVLPGDAGFYVDVGAASPDNSSVTRHFYEMGWHGINIEPRPDSAALLRERRPRDINVQVAVGAHDGVTSLYYVKEDPDLSTIDAADLAYLTQQGYTYTTEEVKVNSMNTILSVCGATSIDFLKIDAEGAEEAVLRGTDFRRWRPQIIVVEAVRPWSRERTDAGWRTILEANDYREGLFDGVNMFFAPSERPHLFANLVPASPVDNYQTAEVVALQRELDWHRARMELAATGEDCLPKLTPVPPWQRIAVIGTPGCGNTWVAAVLARALGAEPTEAAHPADVRWSSLPDRTVIELPWGRTAELQQRLAAHGIRVVSPARQPLEALIDTFQLRHAGGQPVNGLSDEFLQWALSDEARKLATITAEWWSTPATVRVRYEDLRADPAVEFGLLLQQARLPARPGLSLAGNDVHRPGIRLSSSQWDRLLDTYAKSFEVLGYPRKAPLGSTAE